MRGIPILGHAVEFRENPLPVLMRAMLEHGDAVCIHLLHQRVHLLNNPEMIRHVLHDNDDNYLRGEKSHGELRKVLGAGMLTSDGPEWRCYRENAQPAFKQRHLAEMGAQMTAAARAMVARWEGFAREGRPVNLATETMRLTAAIAATTMFGYPLSSDEADAFVDDLAVAQTDMFHRVITPVNLPLAVPTPYHRRVQAAIDGLHALARRIVERNAPEDEPKTYLTALKGANGPSGARMSAEELRNQVLTMLVAAAENPSNTLTWMMVALDRYPGVERRVRDEMQRKLGGGAPSFEDIAQLSYTSMVIHETMRLYPGAWGFERQAIRDDVVGGYHLPAGALVLLCPYTMHRNPRYWEQPDAFIPERFLPERIATMPKYAFYPFGGGSRQCIGNRYALMEMMLVLPMILRRFQIRLAEGQDVEPLPLFTLRPRNGVFAMLEPLEAPSTRQMPSQRAPAFPSRAREHVSS